MINQLIYVLLVIVVCTVPALGQSAYIDSLRLELDKAQSDSNKVKTLNTLIFELSYGEKSEALTLLNESINLSKKIKYPYGLADAYSLYGQIHIDKGNHDSAQYYYLKALEYFESQKILDKQFRCYKKLAQVHQERNSFEQSRYYIEKLFEIAEESDDSKMKGNANNSYAAFFINQGWDLVDNHNDTINYITYFEEAKPYIYKAIENFEDAGYEKGMALAYGNLCILNKEMGQLEEALENIKSANEYFTRMDQKVFMVSAYNHINTIFQKMNMYDSALYYNDKSFALAKELESKFDLRNAYGQYAYIYRYLNDFHKYYEYHGLYDDINSQLLAENKQALIDEMEVKYKAKEKEKELVLQEIENRNQKQILFLLGFGALVLIMVIVIIWVRNQKEKNLNQLLQEKTEMLEVMNHEIRQQRDQLKENNNIILQQNAKINEAYQEQGNLMAVVAHDLRSPLNNVKGLNDLLSITGEMTDEQNELVTKTSEVANHGLEIINDMMSLYQYQNESETNYEKVEINGLLKELVSAHSANATRKNISIQLNCPKSKGLIELNKIHFTRIMDNLISNAIKFSPYESQIDVSCKKEKNQIHFFIKDQGPGFSEKDRESLFKRFKKLSAQPTGGEKSSGLGLSIVKTLVDKMNGKIELDNNSGNGSTFKITLPNQANTKDNII